MRRLPTPGAAHSPAWSPRGNASIWIVEPESSQPFGKLIELSGEVRPRGITWTSDGSSLVFGRQEALSDLALFERLEQDSR
jgi:hypothetical protein